MQRRAWMRLGLGMIAGATAGGAVVAIRRDEWFEKRVAVVHPGRAIRGAWQGPEPLRRIIAREQIRTIVTLTAINADDPKYVGQIAVVRDTGVAWRFVRMRGSKATPEQMAEAADLIADPANGPVFFHCVAGHHRTSLAHAALRIRHEGWTAAQAWAEVSALPWARPKSDHADLRQIEAFAASRFGARQGA
ncbi:hypothetical protein TA3x_005362 [Tundrisphaera sp. TA3]|uniref:hypothetical protein n=1 Tax=Tundrisphaera sp. TA3 TaxID=3435775 RepID=UPI003EBDB043